MGSKAHPSVSFLLGAIRFTQPYNSKKWVWGGKRWVQVKNPPMSILKPSDKIDEQIREVHMTMEKFSESEDFYRLLFKNSDNAIFVLPVLPDGMLGKFIEVNEMHAKARLYEEDLLALSLADIDAPDMAERRRSALKELLANKHVIFETIVIAKDGRRIHIEVNANYLSTKASL